MRLGPVSGHLNLRHGWLRIFGAGVAWKDVSRYPLIFSERTGHTKTYRIGRWSFKRLRRGR